MFENFDIEPYKKMYPPGDNTFDTMQEIKALTKIPLNKKFVEKYDDLTSAFLEVARRNDLPEKEIKDISNSLSMDSYPIIMELKEHFDRPRPKVMAKVMNIPLEDHELKSMKTPSYPSGHSAQAYLVALTLSLMYPKYKKDFMQVADNISDSRNVAHAHYKSDSDFGKKLGADLALHISKKQI